MITPLLSQFFLNEILARQKWVGGRGGLGGVWEGSLASTELNWRFPLHYDVFSFFLIFVYA